MTIDIQWSSRAAEQQARVRLGERLAELMELPYSRQLLDGYGLGHVADAPSASLRFTDLASAVHRLEYATETSRAPMAVEPFVTSADAERHPGFDGVEEEILAEERWLSSVAASVLP